MFVGSILSIGILNLREVNQAFKVKLGWRLLSRPDLQGSQIIQPKYGGWPTLRDEISKLASSHSWKNIQAMAEIIRKRICWKLNRGNRISLWHDCWVTEEPLWLEATRPLMTDAQNHTVMDYWLPDTGWDWATLYPVLSATMLEKLRGTHYWPDHPDEDIPYCHLTSNGQFDLNSAKHLLRDGGGQENPFNWKAIWHFKVPSCAYFTLWFVLHRGLPTKQLLCHRKIIGTPECKCCGTVVQTDLHILRDCTLAEQTRCRVLPRGEWRQFFETADCAV